MGDAPELLKELPGYDPDIAKNRAEARQIMQKVGYGSGKSLPVKVSARDLPPARNAGALLIDQLKHIDINGELEIIDTSLYYPKILRKDFTVGVNGQFSGPDPDPTLDVLYGCGSSPNWDGYCNPEVDKMIEQQSMEGDAARRKQILWAIERKLAADVARPIIFYERVATCWQPYVKGPTMMVDSIHSNRQEDGWLDK